MIYDESDGLEALVQDKSPAHGIALTLVAVLVAVLYGAWRTCARVFKVGIRKGDQ